MQLQFGGSQSLLSGIQLAPRGDLYLPADDSYLLLARDNGLLAEMLPLARMKAVLAVPKGNPKQLRSVDDLVRGKVRRPALQPEFDLALRAARLTTHPGFDRLICLPLVRDMEPLEHQVRTVKTVLRRFRGRVPRKITASG